MGIQPEWLGSIAAIISTLSGLIYTWTKAGPTRYKYFSVVTTLHRDVYGDYNNLKKITLEYARSFRHLSSNILSILYFVFGFLANLTILTTESSTYFLVTVSVLFLLGIFLLFLKKLDISASNLTEDDVIKRLSTSSWLLMFLIVSFGVVAFSVLFLHTPTSEKIEKIDMYYPGSIIIAGVLTVIGALIFSGIITLGTSVLWKIRVSSNLNFANSLPHLLVKTKTGNIFFGQLYDPFDDKLLILRKAKLVIHGEQEVWDTLGKIVSHEVSPNTQENYLSIPWDEIEALQIVEEGLYRVRLGKTRLIKIECEGKVMECEILEQE